MNRGKGGRRRARAETVLMAANPGFGASQVQVPERLLQSHAGLEPALALLTHARSDRCGTAAEYLDVAAQFPGLAGYAESLELKELQAYTLVEAVAHADLEDLKELLRHFELLPAHQRSARLQEPHAQALYFGVARGVQEFRAGQLDHLEPAWKLEERFHRLTYRHLPPIQAWQARALTLLHEAVSDDSGGRRRVYQRFARLAYFSSREELQSLMAEAILAYLKANLNRGNLVMTDAEGALRHLSGLPSIQHSEVLQERLAQGLREVHDAYLRRDQQEAAASALGRIRTLRYFPRSPTLQVQLAAGLRALGRQRSGVEEQLAVLEEISRLPAYPCDDLIEEYAAGLAEIGSGPEVLEKISAIPGFIESQAAQEAYAALLLGACQEAPSWDEARRFAAELEGLPLAGSSGVAAQVARLDQAVALAAVRDPSLGVVELLRLGQSLLERCLAGGSRRSTRALAAEVLFNRVLELEPAQGAALRGRQKALELQS